MNSYLPEKMVNKQIGHEVTPNEGAPPIKVFVAFDEEASADEAQRLISRLAPDEFCQTDMCELNLLSSPPQAQTATHSAAEADLLIIAMHDGNRLTPAASAWLGELLTTRDIHHDGALVALLSGPDSQAASNAELLAGLETLAGFGGLTFFAGRPGQ